MHFEKADHVDSGGDTPIFTERIGTHLLKTFGYFVDKQGIDLAMIQKLMNHSNETETLRYIGIHKGTI
nr:hypothetical protein [Neobacillus mesonae]